MGDRWEAWWGGSVGCRVTGLGRCELGNGLETHLCGGRREILHLSVENCCDTFFIDPLDGHPYIGLTPAVQHRRLPYPQPTPSVLPLPPKQPQDLAILKDPGKRKPLTDKSQNPTPDLFYRTRQPRTSHDHHPASLYASLPLPTLKLRRTQADTSKSPKAHTLPSAQHIFTRSAINTPRPGSLPTP